MSLASRWHAGTPSRRPKKTRRWRTFARLGGDAVTSLCFVQTDVIEAILDVEGHPVVPFGREQPETCCRQWRTTTPSRLGLGCVGLSSLPSWAARPRLEACLVALVAAVVERHCTRLSRCLSAMGNDSAFATRHGRNNGGLFYFDFGILFISHLTRAGRRSAAPFGF